MRCADIADTRPPWLSSGWSHSGFCCEDAGVITCSWSKNHSYRYDKRENKGYCEM